MKSTKNTLIAVLVILAILFSIFSAPVKAITTPNGITILLDGDKVDFDVPPFIEGGHTYVPFRAIFEAFGFAVRYYEQSEQIYATLQTERNSVQYWIDLKEKTISCEGVEYDPDTLVESPIAAGKMEAEKIGSVMFQKPIEIKNMNGRTFVQARVIAESLGCRVDWNGRTKTVVITSENAVIFGNPQSKLSSEVTLDRSGILEARAAKYKTAEDELVKLVNEARENIGLSMLEKDDSLTKAARMQAQYMADNEIESCTDTEVKNLVNANYGQITWINVAKNIGGKTTDEIMTTLTNIYSSKTTKIGIGGAADKGGKMYWICVSVLPFDDAEKTVLEDEVIRFVNEERIKDGLNPVIKNDDLAKVARMKAQDNVDNKNYSHESITYGSAEKMVKDYVKNVKFSGENLEFGSKTPEKVVLVSWWNSPEHKAIMMQKDSDYIGVGVAMTEDGDFYWVLITGTQY